MPLTFTKNFESVVVNFFKNLKVPLFDVMSLKIVEDWFKVSWAVEICFHIFGGLIPFFQLAEYAPKNKPGSGCFYADLVIL